MLSDPAKPQPGNPPTEAIGEGSVPQTDSLPAMRSESATSPNEDDHKRETSDLKTQSAAQGATPKNPDEREAQTAEKSAAPDVQSYGANVFPLHGSPAGELKPSLLLQLPQKPLVIDVKRDYLRDFSVLVPGVASVIVGVASVIATIVIAIVANQISQQQAKSMEAQSIAAQEEVNVQFIEEFKKHLAELTIPEEQANQENLTKKTLAAITLAQYRERALPALKMSLTVEDEGIRSGAVVVMVQMLSDKSLRNIVLSRLGDYFDEDNSALRVGVLDCYLTTQHDLSENELIAAKKKIRQYVDPSGNYSERPKEQRVLLWATKFFSNWPSIDSRDFLLAVAKNRTCDNDPREGAINYLAAVTNGAKYSSDQERETSKREILRQLRELLSDAPARLRNNINDAIGKLEGEAGT